MPVDNYTLGRGELHFARFLPGTRTPDGFRYIGNTPEFSLTIESETLDHFSSDRGIREKDDSVPLEVTRTGSLTTDNISPENVALFFFGTDSTITQTLVAPAPETLNNVRPGHSYKLGVTPTVPAGVFGLNATGLTVAKVATPSNINLVADVDYRVDLDAGIITLIETSTQIVLGDEIIVTYGLRAASRSRVISGSEPVEGAIIYRSRNPKGSNAVFYLPYVKITPNGDYALKGDEWQQIPMSIEVLKPSATQEAIYRDGLPAYV